MLDLLNDAFQGSVVGQRGLVELGRLAQDLEGLVVAARHDEPARRLVNQAESR